MRILHALFEIQDYGGIVPYIETISKGFQEMGHTCQLALVRNSTRAVYVKKSAGPPDAFESVVSSQVHLLSGWYGVCVFGYGSVGGQKTWHEYSLDADLVIWHTAPKNEGDWQIMFDIDIPQVFIAHDAHYHRAYKHIDQVADKFQGVVAVHDAAYHNLQGIPAPVTLIGNPHQLLDWDKMERNKPWNKRRPQAVCAHVWKAWKHMDRAVAAVPHMKRKMIMGGDGIEGRYMRSKTKCKPKYKGMWDAFNKAGGDYRGLIPPAELRELYQNSRVMVDLSFSKRFSQFGAHFNRSMHDAYNNGCVPVSVFNNTNDGVWFIPGEDYIGVHEETSPEELADVIDQAIGLSEDDAMSIVHRGREVMKSNFEYHHVGREILNVAKGILP